MIKIEHAKLGAIAAQYYENMKDLINRRVRFYQQLARAIYGGGTVQELYDFSDIHWKTKIKGINIFLAKKKLDNNNSRAQYDNVAIDNVASWIKDKEHTILRILTFLAKEQNIYDLVLASAQEGVEFDRNIKQEFDIYNSDNDKALLAWIAHIIDYGMFDGFAYDIANQLGINTCPYCNRNYINTVILKSNNIIRPQFDHFFPKSVHHFLGLSFYNLIPSCYYCNASLKSASAISHDTHLHPYISGYGEACRFRFFFKELNSSKRHPENYSLFLSSEVPEESRIFRQIFGKNLKEGNNNLFKLGEIYHSAHRDILGELVEKVDRYSSAQADSISRFFGPLSTSKTEFYNFYFGNYINEKDFNRRPMAKLTRDVIKQMIPDFFKEVGL